MVTANTVESVGKSVPVTGWMSEAEKKEFAAAIKQQSFLRGQSDFINRAVEALIKSNKSELAQPLQFLTVKERDALALLKKR